MGADAITEHSLPSLHTRTTLMPPRSLFSQFRPFLFGNRTLLHSFFFQRLLIPFRLIFEWSLSFPFLAKFRGGKCLCDQTIGLSWSGKKQTPAPKNMNPRDSDSRNRAMPDWQSQISPSSWFEKAKKIEAHSSCFWAPSERTNRLRFDGWIALNLAKCLFLIGRNDTCALGRRQAFTQWIGGASWPEVSKLLLRTRREIWTTHLLQCFYIFISGRSYRWSMGHGHI